VITGAARRVGAAIARRFHAAGADVLVHCNRSLDEAEKLVAQLDARRAGSAAGGLDLLDTAKLGLLVETAQRRFGRLDILVNDASTFYPTPIGEITETQSDDLFGSNLKAPLFLSQAAAPALRLARGSSSISIVDIHGMLHCVVIRTARPKPVSSCSRVRSRANSVRKCASTVSRRGP
jgi:pteridine reductase